MTRADHGIHGSTTGRGFAGNWERWRERTGNYRLRNLTTLPDRYRAETLRGTAEKGNAGTPAERIGKDGGDTRSETLRQMESR
jgi:hypothetical protein